MAKIRLVFMGRYGKIYRFAKESDLSVMVAYELKGTRFVGVVGGIFEVEGTKDGKSITTNTFEYIDKIADTRLITEWELKETAYNVRIAADKRMEKAKSDKATLTALEPLGAIYNRLPYTDRLAFEVVVLDYLRRSA